ncbi:MAG TPA: SURF1 family protein [Arsenicitalea sp.]|jgi:surfeit locus 1 family protein|nr:SURF1 family protein [Arsenicitalea sp.]
MMKRAEGTEQDRAPRSLRLLVPLGAFAVLIIAALVALGVWQLDRLSWKLHLIDQVQQRVHATPQAPPSPSAWSNINADDDEYRHLSVTGHFLNDREALVQAVTERGSGYWVMTPFQTDLGFTVLVNRGFIPAERRLAATRAAGEIAGAAVVTGLLRITEPNGGFLRANDPAGDRWFSRDVAAIAAARKLSRVAPYFIDADATPNPGGLPIGGLTVLDFPNNHLIYALTWFALALMLAGAMVFVANDERRIRKSFRARR